MAFSVHFSEAGLQEIGKPSSLPVQLSLAPHQPPFRTSPLSPGPPSRPQSLFPPQTSRRTAPRPPRLARAAAPSPSPRIPTCWVPGLQQERRTAKRSPLADLPLRPNRPPAQETRAGPGRAGRRKDALCGGRPALAAHTPPARLARPPTPPPALAQPPWPSPGHRADAWAPRRRRPPPSGLQSSQPHPDPPATPFLTGGRAGLAGRRKPASRQPAPIGGLPRARARDLAAESSGSGRLGFSVDTTSLFYFYVMLRIEPSAPCIPGHSKKFEMQRFFHSATQTSL
ncbi:uncharacterized protein ACOB7L_015966 [Callospermophilus lateralis]|uniref:uncharacterized protein LOC143400461 n=1 Tax=Callospermophilus lateralis TaxID=76772 RepID=UPI00403886E7